MQLVLRLMLLVIVPIQATAQPEVPGEDSQDPREQAEYRLGRGDVVEIKVRNRPDLSGVAAVDSSGFVLVSLLGRVKAERLLPSELAADLEERYSILDPAISRIVITVLEFVSRKVTVVGEAKVPGRYSFRTIPDLWAVILAAGGPTTRADLSNVQIVRKIREEGDKPTLSVDLSAGIDEMDPASLPKLRLGDTVIIPSQVGETIMGGTKINVLGEVKGPGVYQLTSAKTILEALALAGGHLPEADLSNVILTRPTDEAMVSYHLDIRAYMSDGRPEANFPLKSGDTVTVPRAKRGFLDSVFSGRVVPIVTGVTALILAINVIQE